MTKKNKSTINLVTEANNSIVLAIMRIKESNIQLNANIIADINKLNINIKNFKRTLIYQLYCNNIPNVTIAKTFKCTPGRISQIISEIKKENNTDNFLSTLDINNPIEIITLVDTNNNGDKQYYHKLTKEIRDNEILPDNQELFKTIALFPINNSNINQAKCTVFILKKDNNKSIWIPIDIPIHEIVKDLLVYKRQQYLNKLNKNNY